MRSLLRSAKRMQTQLAGVAILREKTPNQNKQKTIIRGKQTMLSIQRGLNVCGYGLKETIQLVST